MWDSAASVLSAEMARERRTQDGAASAEHFGQRASPLTLTTVATTSPHGSAPLAVHFVHQRPRTPGGRNRDLALAVTGDGLPAPRRSSRRPQHRRNGTTRAQRGADTIRAAPTPLHYPGTLRWNTHTSMGRIIQAPRPRPRTTTPRVQRRGHSPVGAPAKGGEGRVHHIHESTGTPPHHHLREDVREPVTRQPEPRRSESEEPEPREPEPREPVPRELEPREPEKPAPEHHTSQGTRLHRLREDLVQKEREMEEVKESCHQLRDQVVQLQRDLTRRQKVEADRHRRAIDDAVLLRRRTSRRSLHDRLTALISEHFISARVDHKSINSGSSQDEHDLEHGGVAV